MIKPEELERKVKKAVTAGKELATLWGIIQKVREITSNQHSSVKELVKVIGADPVLTAKVLRLVNSAVYGFSGRIANIDQAIVILGFRQLKDLCTGLTILRCVGDSLATSTFDRAALWRHSLATAVAAKFIQERIPGTQSANLFVAGLLCNIGRVVLDQHFPDEFTQIVELAAATGIRLLEAERRILNVTHADIGYWVGSAWCLDESLCTCIRDHHGPSGHKNADVINLAYVLAQLSGNGSPGDPLLTLLTPGTLESLKLDEYEIGLILRGLDHEFETVNATFKIMIEK